MEKDFALPIKDISVPEYIREHSKKSPKLF